MRKKRKVFHNWVWKRFGKPLEKQENGGEAGIDKSSNM